MIEKPTVEEIAAYIEENKLVGFTAEQFLSYYETSVSGKVKDWKKVANCWSNWNSFMKHNDKAALDLYKHHLESEEQI